MGTGDRRRLANFEPGLRTLRLLPDDVAGNGLFLQPDLFVIEQKVNPEVKDYNDALWWAFMDVTTVGSNIIAITPTGRILSVLLAALGMMMFPIFTVYVTSLVQSANKKKKIIIIKRIPSPPDKHQKPNRPVPLKQTNKFKTTYCKKQVI